MRSRHLLIVGAVAVGLTACGGGDRPYAGPLLQHGVADRANDNVSLTARDNMVALAWSTSADAGMNVYAAVSLDGGKSFGAPLRVNADDGGARVSGEQPPRAVLIPDPDGFPQPFVVWTRKEPGGTRIVWSYTKDGTTFSAPAVVPGADGAGNRGWESLALDASDHPLLVWLDHRETAATAVAPMHQHEGMTGGTAPPAAGAPGDAPKPDPVERAGLSRLWFSAADGSVPPTQITGGVCYCCKTALAVSGQRVVAAWRHVYDGNQRDIAFAQSLDGGRTFSAPVRVSEDHWKFDGCPENGPAIAIDQAGAVHIAWITPLGGVEGAPLALYTASTADGATFTPRAHVSAKGATAHAQLVADKRGGLVLAWDEATPAGRVVRVARGTVGGDGLTSFGKPATMAGAGDHPALAAPDSGAVLAWIRRDPGTNSVINLIRVP
jgi:hypothetical protein